MAQYVGTVIGTKMDKTAKVLVTRMALYKKLKTFFNERKVYFAHDENNECARGDLVVIKECQRMTNRKYFTVSEIIDKVPRVVDPETGQMKPEVEMYFTDPANLSKKYHSQLSQVIEFQKSHRQRLAANNEKKEENSHLKRLLANSSSRPVTPHNYRNSPGAAPMKRGHTPSPTGSQYSASPYGRTPPNSSQKENKALNQWQNQLSRSASGPARLSVRTPPCNGFMGTVRRTPSPNKQLLSRPGSAGGTPGTILRSHLQGMHLSRTANTPGSYEAATPSGLGAAGGPYSPMSMSSPALTARSSTPGNNRLSNRSQYTTPSSSQSATQSSSTPNQTDHCSPKIPTKISDNQQATICVFFTLESEYSPGSQLSSGNARQV
ncbi:hypothetical protein ACROYT_G012100 [Oculina patagonica]